MFFNMKFVTTLTNYRLRGTRGALTFYRIGTKKIDKKGKALKYNF